MTRRTETIVTLVGAGLIALTTVGLYLLDLADWPALLIGLGALLALGAIGLHAADRRERRNGWMPLMPEAALTDEKGGAETSAHPQRGEEPPAMIPLPTACPTCKTAGILYSVGVIRSAFPSVWREYPVVWCAHCRRAYFTCLPSILWCRCTVHPHGMAFTTDPETIDHSLKLAYDYTIVRDHKRYRVYPASQA